MVGNSTQSWEEIKQADDYITVGEPMKELEPINNVRTHAGSAISAETRTRQSKLCCCCCCYPFPSHLCV